MQKIAMTSGAVFISLDLQYAAVIPIFIARVSQSKPPIIYGDGEQSRDFTFVKDVVQANIIGAESDACGVFNILEV